MNGHINNLRDKLRKNEETFINESDDSKSQRIAHPKMGRTTPKLKPFC